MEIILLTEYKHFMLSMLSTRNTRISIPVRFIDCASIQRFSICYTTYDVLYMLHNIRYRMDEW